MCTIRSVVVRKRFRAWSHPVLLRAVVATKMRHRLEDTNTHILAETNTHANRPNSDFFSTSSSFSILVGWLFDRFNSFIYRCFIDICIHICILILLLLIVKYKYNAIECWTRFFWLQQFMILHSTTIVLFNIQVYMVDVFVSSQRLRNHFIYIYYIYNNE